MENASSHSDDFGGLVRRYPARVLRATSLVEVVKAVETSRTTGLPLAVRGTGHSTRGQSLVEGGLVLDVTGLRDVTIDGHTATVGAGARWDQVVSESLRHGLTVPVLPDYLGITVGGTLSVGGVGGQSFQHGLLTSAVERLTVVSGEGEVISCSRDRNADLFDAVRGGLGQCGVITSATIRLVRAPDRVAIAKLRYGALADLMTDQRKLSLGGFLDYFLTSFDVEDGRFRLSIEGAKYLYGTERHRAESILAELGAGAREATFQESSYFDYANRLAGLPELDRQNGRFHPWMDMFVPASRGEAFLADLLARLEPHELAEGHLMTYVVDRKKIDTPIIAWPDEERLLLVDILPTFASLAEATSFTRRCVPILGRARALGAVVYPIGFPVGTDHMTRDDWKRHFDWERLIAAKRRADPSCRLGASLGIVTRADVG